MKTNNYELVKLAIPLWYAHVAWAKELLIRTFDLDNAIDILRPENRGIRQILGTVWFVRTHGVGVDIFKSSTVGGVDLILISLIQIRGVLEFLLKSRLMMGTFNILSIES